MSPASYLAAPPRVAVVNCSTLVTIRSMWDWLVYGALLAAALAVIAALANFTARALLAWRDFKRLRRHVGKELTRVGALAEVTAEKAARAGDTEELETSLARLRVSLARVAVLRAAFADATSWIPRK